MVVVGVGLVWAHLRACSLGYSGGLDGALHAGLRRYKPDVSFIDS